MQVSRADGHYSVQARMRLAVSAATAFRAATDYDRLPDFNPDILRSERQPDRRLRSSVRLCAAFVCKTVDQVMRYRENAPETLDMTVVPGAGDLKSGSAHWRFEPEGPQVTRLSFSADIEPAFWVPPLIGPYLIARELRRQAQVTAGAIEKLASDYAAQ